MIGLPASLPYVAPAIGFACGLAIGAVFRPPWKALAIYRAAFAAGRGWALG